jgi:hypothetical protein
MVLQSDVSLKVSTLDLILRITSTGATLLIGVAASFLAYRQYTISKQKLRLDLYNKRYELFLKLRMFVSDLAIGDNREPLEIQNKAGAFKRDTIECRFLFDADVAAYFDTVCKKAGELVTVQLDFRRPNLTNEQEDALRTRLTDLHVWFFNQSDEMFALFKKDLSIKTLQ